MTGKGGGRCGPVKTPKKLKPQQEEEEEDDRLEDLVVETDPDKRQTSYSNLEPGGFVTKGADRKSRLDQRHSRIAAAAGEQDDDDNDKDEQNKKSWSVRLTNCPANSRKWRGQRHWHVTKKNGIRPKDIVDVYQRDVT